ncbi:predicted protein [Naegleria gruberi]|uniref:Predicted protein n=1 Tax=Naegleria gruberi TaxID=5762 RepID=D2UX50_NAEGR|nr:uncharacterized protein NAEGRDRAFT_61636 [Naegleria gruberi]EFC50562.1 predicted protein [Naegleria gruberi]|eukprot:XP_002683306.1 predicted protein [Naegleria gruberi strain NEG-M]
MSGVDKKLNHDSSVQKRMMKEYASGVLPTLSKFEFITTDENIRDDDEDAPLYKFPLKKIVISDQSKIVDGIEVEYMCKMSAPNFKSDDARNFHNYTPSCNIFNSQSIEKDEKLSSVEEIYVFVPGNPGNCLIYHEFLERLCERLDNQEEEKNRLVIAVSLRGHSYYYPSQFWQGLTLFKSNSSSSSLYHSLEAYNLNDQVDYFTLIVQKLHRQFPNAKLILQGHSVGCFLISKVMERLNVCKKKSHHPIVQPLTQTIVDNAVDKLIFFYPTVQNMHSETPNGQSLLQYAIKAPLRVYLANLLYNLASPILPTFVIRLSRRSSPILVPWIPYYVDSMRIIKNVTTLASHEFEEILDSFGNDSSQNTFKDAMRDHKDKLRVIFSTADLWVPRKHVLSFLDHVFDVNSYEGKTILELENSTVVDEQEFCKILDKACLNVGISNQVTFSHTTQHAFVIHQDNLEITSKLPLR